MANGAEAVLTTFRRVDNQSSKWRPLVDQPAFRDFPTTALWDSPVDRGRLSG